MACLQRHAAGFHGVTQMRPSRFERGDFLTRVCRQWIVIDPLGGGGGSQARAGAQGRVVTPPVTSDSMAPVAGVRARLPFVQP